MSKVIDITMRYRKSTPGTHVFEEIDETRESLQPIIPSIPSLYIRKGILGEPAQKIRVTVEILK